MASDASVNNFTKAVQRLTAAQERTAKAVEHNTAVLIEIGQLMKENQDGNKEGEASSGAGEARSVDGGSP